MGQMKHLLDGMERQQAVTTSIAVKAKVPERCEFHEDNVYLGENDIEEAYKLGNAWFTAGKLKSVFSDRKEMTDEIQSVVEAISADECLDCAKWATE